jgi:hypothetical protein
MFNVDEITIDKENDGVWAPFKGSEFLIASSGCNKFQRMFSKLQMPHRKAIDRRKLDPEIQLDIMAKAMSSSLLLDWRNVCDNSGKDVKFTKEAAYNVLKSNSEFRDFITEFSTEIENYISDEKEDLGKSVKKSSTGESNLEVA